MNDLTCALCGYKGPDVSSRVVEVEPTRTVTVYATTPPVPERWRVLPVCGDRERCGDRQYAKEPV